MNALATVETSIPPPVKRGAPTSYREEYCDAVIEYFERPREVRSVEVSSEDGPFGLKTSYRTICAELPDLAGFCRSIGISRETLYQWQKRHPAFADSCARARLVAESLVADRANNGLYNAASAQFYQKNVFGWTDKTQIETINSQDSQDMGNMRAALASATPDELAAIAEVFARIEARRALPAVDTSGM